MVDFALPLLYSYILSGYRYLLYYNLEHCALIVPLRDYCETSGESYLVPIADEQAFEMACGTEEFYFYVLS